jgi:hypothetical protein
VIGVSLYCTALYCVTVIHRPTKAIDQLSDAVDARMKGERREREREYKFDVCALFSFLSWITVAAGTTQIPR